MRVLFVHDATFKYDDEGNYYGTSVNPKTMSRYLYFDDKVDVLIRTAPFNDNYDKKRYTKITDNFNIINCPRYMDIKGLFTQLGKVKKMVKQLVSEGDIVFTRFSGMTGMLAAREAHKQNKCYVVESVGCPFDSFWNYNIKGKFFAPIMYFMAKSRIKEAPYVVYVTSKFLQGRYPTEGRCIAASNVELKATDEKVLAARLEKIKARKADDPIVLGTAAAIDVPGKGHAYVIEAIARLKNEDYNFQYNIIGTGKPDRLRSIAQRLGVEDRVHFMGVLKQDAVFDWDDELDIYIQPSNQEGLPRAMIEAMSRACPAIGSSTAGIPELVDASCIFTRKNVDELCEILRKFDNDKMYEQAQKNFNEAIKYTEDIIYKRREEFYQSIIDEHPELLAESDGENY